MQKPLVVGDTLPDVALIDQTGASWSKDKILQQGSAFLVFYPGDLTPGCTVQLCTLRDDWTSFQKNGIGIFGVNPGGQKGHKLFASLYHLPFPLLVDEDKQLSHQFGIVNKKLGFEFLKRTVIGIDKSGIIRYIKDGMPKPAELLKEAAKWKST